MNRRIFCKSSLYASALTAVNTLPIAASLFDDDIVKLTILHTNDVHSRIDPFPMDGSRNAGQGGAAKRAALIKSIRKVEKNILLFDSGDIFQGTPYFNMFGGELEMKLMSEMKYDAATMGNHDFDAGIDGFMKQIKHANFPFILSNYEVSDNELSEVLLKTKTWEIDGIKVGLYGLGIELEGLVPLALYGNTLYQDPIEKAKIYEAYLKQVEKCDYVICLSHLGYRYRDDKVSDVVLAQQTEHTDLILGGHTHTFMKEPDVQKNKRDMPVFINQAGWAGILLGRVDLMFEKSKKRKNFKSTNLSIG